MTSYAQQERAAICDSFLRLGPDAPTIDDPWLARDLAAHLVIRDSRPDLSAGMYISAFKGRLDEAMREYASSDYAWALRPGHRPGSAGWTKRSTAASSSSTTRTCCAARPVSSAASWTSA